MQGSPAASDTARLELIASAVRAFLEPDWWRSWQGAEAEGVPASAGMCGRSSLTLKHVLNRDFDIDANWASGTPPFRDRRGAAGAGFLWLDQWVGHAWVEAEGGLIIDITADQFDGAPVIVTPAGDPRYRANEETATAAYRAVRERVSEDAWLGWLASGERADLMRKLDRSAGV